MQEDFGRYRIEYLLGKGTMGAVYRGFDPENQRAVAIKVLAPQGAAGRVKADDLRERFEREAEAHKRLRHPGIVGLYDVGVTASNRPYLVMEFVAGLSADQRLERDGSLSPLLVAQIGASVADALHHAHTEGFIHRDVKPANILIGDDGAAKLMDFGIARTTMSNLTAEGEFLGSVLFSSPEQALVQPLDGRSDLFSLGTSLYVLVTGRHPFSRKTLEASIDAITKEDPTPATWLRPELGPAWDDVLAGALAKEPGQRYADGQAMAHALAELTDPARSLRQAHETEAFDLVILRGPEAGKRIPLEDSNTVGRQGASIVLTDPRISGRHCTIVVHRQKVTVTDLKSRNGTWVDRKRIESADLTPLNELWFGPDTSARILPRPAVVDSVERALKGKARDSATRVMPGAVEYVLVVESGPLKGARFPLGGSLLLSRSQGHGRLDDPAVSTEHALVEVMGGRVHVKDLQSRNGTQLDGVRIQEAAMEPGQRLEVGQTVLVLRRADAV